MMYEDVVYGEGEQETPIQVFIQIKQGGSTVEIRDAYKSGSTWKQLMYSYSKALAGHGYPKVYETLEYEGVVEL